MIRAYTVGAGGGVGSSPFPICDPAWHNPEQWMDPRWCCRLFFEPLRCAGFELLAQVTPLEVDLASRHIDMSRSAARVDPGRIKPVSALDRFGVHGFEILGDER